MCHKWSFIVFASIVASTVLASLSFAAPLAVTLAEKPTVSIALTFDDLPAHGTPGPYASHRAVGRSIIDTLAKNQIQGVVAFANLGLFEEGIQPDSRTYLGAKDWIDAGHFLGNHTLTHINLNETTVSEYLAQVASNHRLLTTHFSSAFFATFRFPFLHEGATQELRSKVRVGIQDQGYRFAPVTIDLEDWAFREAHERCTAQNNQAALDQLRGHFLKNAGDRIYYAHLLALRLGFQNFKHILLTHYAAFVAQNLEPLFASLKQDPRFDAQWITLRQALEDPLYQQDPGTPSPHGSGFLEQWIRSRRLSWPSGRPSLPTQALDSICR